MRYFMGGVMLFTALLMVGWYPTEPSVHPADGWEKQIDTILAKMTLQEKIGQLTQYSAKWVETPAPGHLAPDLTEMVRQGGIGSFLNLTGARRSREIQRIAVEESRLHIPLIFGLDVIHGYRTIFPIPLAEASTWDPDLVKASARVAAREASSGGVHWTFAPMVDVARDPRWGRMAEGSGEDPYLGSVMAVARVQGFQGQDLAADSTILACPKHFAAYGAAESGRDYNTVDISERTLREVYLPPFEASVRAGAATIMCSFNEIAGIPSSANKVLLTDILRGEWGFTGFVVSDWGSIAELIPHGKAASLGDAATLALRAGVDMDMQGSAFHDSLVSRVTNGTVPVSGVDGAVRRVLRAKFRLGLFEDPYRYCSPDREQHTILRQDHVALAREVARKSIVLLKNENRLLPLRKDLKTLAVVGPLADNQIDPLGPWHALGESGTVVSALAGIRSAVSPVTRIVYVKGCDVDGTDRSGTKDLARKLQSADAVVAVVGESREMSGEAASRSSIGLPGAQEELVRALVATKKPLVVVLMNGRSLAIPWIAEHVPAIVEGWFLGIETGHALADVIFGDYNPAGKLPVSFPRSVGQSPLYYNHKNTGRPTDGKEKFTSRYIDVSNEPQFPFGYGLSYARFEYSKPALNAQTIRSGEAVHVSVRVTNLGPCDGEEVVQLYLRDDVASVTRPVKELRGFARVSLRTGESRHLTFTVTADQMSFYNMEMKRVVEPGRFTVYVGGNSRDVGEASFTVVAE
jgi:beta-glucosidase